MSEPQQNFFELDPYSVDWDELVADAPNLYDTMAFICESFMTMQRQAERLDSGEASVEELIDIRKTAHQRLAFYLAALPPKIAQQMLESYTEQHEKLRELTEGNKRRARKILRKWGMVE
jgi:hypothetical protein